MMNKLAVAACGSFALLVSSPAIAQSVKITFDGALTGYRTYGPNGAAYVPGSGLSYDQSVFSLTAIADGILDSSMTQYPDRRNYYSLSHISFKLNGVELINDASPGLRAFIWVEDADTTQTWFTPVDRLGLSVFSKSDFDSTLDGEESREFNLAYSLNATTFTSTAIPTNASFTSAPISSQFAYDFQGGNWPNLSSAEANSYYQLDGAVWSLSLEDAAVPEPATWAMMLLGFGGMGYAMRRRSKVSTRIRFA